MSKSMLVIDTPGNCASCPLKASYRLDANSRIDVSWCVIHPSFVIEDFQSGRAKFCPLKPVPNPLAPPNVNPPPPPIDRRPMNRITPPPKTPETAKSPVNMRSGQESAFMASLDLRDYFAGQWLAGAAEGNDGLYEEAMYDYAQKAYRVADVMIAVREASEVTNAEE